VLVVVALLASIGGIAWFAVEAKIAERAVANEQGKLLAIRSPCRVVGTLVI
jgi:hypothetical protein